MPAYVNRESFALTPQEWDTILAHLAEGWSMTASARSVHATRQCIYDRMERDPDFARQVQECRQEAVEVVEDIVRECANDPNRFLDRIAWLRAHAPAKWLDKAQERQTQVQLQPNISITINVPPSAELPPQLQHIVLGSIDEVREPGEHAQLDAPCDAGDST